LEAGTLPLFGPSISSDFLAWIKKHINMSAWYDWCNIESMNLSNEIKIKAQADMIAQWTRWKMDIQKACRTII